MLAVIKETSKEPGLHVSKSTSDIQKIQSNPFTSLKDFTQPSAGYMAGSCRVANIFKHLFSIIHSHLLTMRSGLDLAPYIII